MRVRADRRTAFTVCAQLVIVLASNAGGCFEAIMTVLYGACGVGALRAVAVGDVARNAGEASGTGLALGA